MGAGSSDIISRFIAQDAGLTTALANLKNQFATTPQPLSKWPEWADEASDAIQDMSEESVSRLDTVKSKLLEVASTATSKVVGAFKSVGKTVATTLLPLGVVGTLGWGVKLAAEGEVADKAMGKLLGSAAKAKLLRAELTTLADEATYTAGTLNGIGRQLAAFNFEAHKITPTVKMLGDVSAGVGTRIEEVADIYGKARVQGRLMNEDLMQFQGRGIPVIQALAKVLGVAEGEVKDLVSTGVVEFSHLEKAFQVMTSEGGQFADMMKVMSDSTEGRMGVLQDKFQQFAKTLGEALLPALNGILDELSSFVEYLRTSDALFARILRNATEFLADREGRADAYAIDAAHDKLISAQKRLATQVRWFVPELDWTKLHSGARDAFGFIKLDFMNLEHELDKGIKDGTLDLSKRPKVAALYQEFKAAKDEMLAIEKRMADRDAKKAEAEDRLRKLELEAEEEKKRQEDARAEDAKADEPPKPLFSPEAGAAAFKATGDWLAKAAMAVDNANDDMQRLARIQDTPFRLAGEFINNQLRPYSWFQRIQRQLANDFQPTDDLHQARVEGLTSLYDRISAAAASQHRDDPLLGEAKAQRKVMEQVGAGVAVIAGKLAADPQKAVKEAVVAVQDVGKKLQNLVPKWGA